MDWLFGSIWLFAIVFVALYVPLAIIIGYRHRKTQWTVEQEDSFSREQSRCYYVVIHDGSH